tara:strand:- start:6460 stop:7974 length:1515 start_codon:yes stop_codon:yes gene_type:complete
MSIKELIETLHPLERKVIPVLKENIELKEIIEKTKLKDIEAIRALQWLQNKHVIKIRQELKEVINLDDNGIKYLKEKLPETRFLKALSKELSFNEIKKKAHLSEDEFNISFGLLKKNDFISINKDKIKITKKGKEFSDKQENEKFLKELPLETKDLDKDNKEVYFGLKKRKNIIKTDLLKLRFVELNEIGKKLIKEKIDTDLIETLTIDSLRNRSWKGKKFRRYDIEVNVPKIYPGKRHFVSQSIEYAKKIWLNMGFKEMSGPMVDTSFWVFDALFTAQDHPVREMQDTYFIKNLKYGKLPNKKLIDAIKNSHENGSNTGSKGWRYKWDAKEAEKNVLRTHTTNLSARTLSNLKKIEWPAKYFAVGRCFRNETIDWSHLFEFNQTEGIVIDPDANFRHLLGYLKEFFRKMGFERARFRPAYFAYTEPSVEIDVIHPIHKKWIELGGAGMFRPEVTKALLGEEVPVLAWGPGFDRVMMDYYKINDMREIYKNDLKQLREMKVWLK